MKPNWFASRRGLPPLVALAVLGLGGCFPTFTFLPDGDADGGTEGMIVLQKGPSQLEVQYGAAIRYLRLDSYRIAIDRYEVNVRDFKDWVDAGKPVPKDGAILDTGPYKNVMVWRKEWNSAAQSSAFRDARRIGVGGRKSATYEGGYSNGSAGSNADPPAVDNVPWEQALAYCAYRGARLPTLPEWIYAANVDIGILKFPWGSEAPNSNCKRALYSGLPTVADGAIVTAPSSCDPYRGTQDFTAGQTPEGVFGLAGGVREWTWDLADDVPPPATTAPYASEDSLSVNAERYVMGGSYLAGADELVIRNYTHTNSQATIGDVGFRCVKSR